MSDIRYCVLAAGAAVALSAMLPAVLHAQADRPRVEAGANVLRLSLTGWIQPRYEFAHADDGEDVSGFTLRRARLDVQGSVLDERLTFRIMPELARTASLRDGWVEFAFSAASRVRFGQFTVPFQWHRAVSPGRQQFAERGVPSETFGFPNGRDIGVMFHGRNAAQTAQWQAGLFDGAGRNVAGSNSTGHMTSGRLSLALLGTLPRDEVDIVPSPAPLVSVGGGVQGATASDVRAWALGRSTSNRADWLTGTGDVQFRYHGVSIAADGYLRRVWPDDAAVEAYTGAGGMVSAGYTLIANRLDVVGRWSTLRLDRAAAETGHTQWGGGVNIYHIGHDSKIRVQYLHDRNETLIGDAVRSGIFLVEYHVQF